jgi:hypothetical protein
MYVRILSVPFMLIALTATPLRALTQGTMEVVIFPPHIYVGEELPISVSCKNTGDTDWEGSHASSPSCEVWLSDASWNRDFGFYGYNWETVPFFAGTSRTTTYWSVSADRLPRAPGTYSMNLRARISNPAWRPGVDPYDDRHILLSPAVIPLVFEIRQATRWDQGRYAFPLANWFRLLWWGNYFDAGNGWVFHSEHGWIYVSGNSPTSVWLWQQNLGWVWTSHLTYPSLYSQDFSAWLFYLRPSTQPRWFYRHYSPEHMSRPPGWISVP